MSETGSPVQILSPLPYAHLRTSTPPPHICRHALADVWAAGAYAWTDEQREAYANDPMVLLAVDGPTNTSKSAKGPSDWMPPNTAYACTYVASYVQISAKYSLSIADADRHAIDQVLAGCGEAACDGSRSRQGELDGGEPLPPSPRSSPSRSGPPSR
ncbi:MULTISPECIES: GmrSD restriction endonuclease domain-containing protein [Microbacterium]|uniref:GmrSD restriction endonuclease domain-containing protein n=1 Tax=Microbacterium TaxID=33882 RepID=UPI0011EAC26C